MSNLSMYGVRLDTNEPDINEDSQTFEKLLELTKTFEKSKCYYKKFTSYKFKHILENYFKEITKGEITYVANGELIRAMELAGFKWKLSSSGRNVYFNVSSLTIKRFEKYLNCV